MIEIEAIEVSISSGLVGLSMGAQYAPISIGFTLSHSVGLPYVAAAGLAMVGTVILGYVIECRRRLSSDPPLE